MKCKTCAHPQCPAIDQALLTRTHTLEALSQQYGLTVSSLHRHKQHLVENLDRARDRLRNNQQLGQLLKLNTLLDKVERAVDAADAAGDVDRVVRGASAGARIIKQMSQIEVNLELDTVHRIISSPQWLTQASLLPTDPQLLTDLHQTIADIAFSPCPDPEPDEISLAIHDSLLQPQNSALKSPATRQLSAPPPPHLRQKSAKLPKKISLCTNNNQEYQSDNLCEKNIAPNPHVGRKSEAHPAVMAGEASPCIQPPPLRLRHHSPGPCPESGLRPPETCPPETVLAAKGNSEPETQDPEQYWDCLVPLKNERTARRGIF